MKMKIFLLPNLKKTNCVEVTKTSINILVQAGAECLLTSAMQQTFSGCSGVTFLDEDTAFKKCDIVLAIGGDGTILSAVFKSLKYDKPIAGINIGRVGFLATIDAAEIEKLTLLAHNKYYVEKRAMINAKVVDAQGKLLREEDALNDIVIAKGTFTHVVSFEIWCNDDLVNAFRGDGIVFATATGSTAYSLSAGGAIVDTSLEAIVATPICAHSLNSPSVVYSGDRTLVLDMPEHAKYDVLLSADGRPPFKINGNAKVVITKSKVAAKLITFNTISQLIAIDSKLKGRR